MSVVRWLGKSTSGRYVYQGRSSKQWYWQCDLHDDLPDWVDSPSGKANSMKDALDAALEHAKVCPFTNYEESD